MEREEKWLSIVDYSKYKGISISTVRRYIKANSVKYIKKKGKFLISVPVEEYRRGIFEKNDMYEEIKKLQNKIEELLEENIDLKMLISIYESKLNLKSQKQSLNYNITQ